MNNATINSWKRTTATTGAGEPVRSELTMAHKVPCELLHPGAARKATERAAGIHLARVVMVPASALVGVAGLGQPEVGDQLTVALTRRPDVAETIDIVEAIEHDGEAGPEWELKLGVRLGGVDGGGG